MRPPDKPILGGQPRSEANDAEPRRESGCERPSFYCGGRPANAVTRLAIERARASGRKESDGASSQELQRNTAPGSRCGKTA